MNARRRSGGQAIAEFAIAIPLFILLVFGLIDLGRLVYVNNAIAEAAREGARWGSVQQRSANAAGRTAIEAHATGVMAAVPNPVVTVTCERGGALATTCRTNDILIVEISSEVTPLTPVLGQLVGTPTVTATAKVTVNQ